LPAILQPQFSVTCAPEIADLANVQTESARLYALLQQSVDTSLQQPGSCRDTMPPRLTHGNGRNETWDVLPKATGLILKIVEEQKLEKSQVEKLAQVASAIGSQR